MINQTLNNGESRTPSVSGNYIFCDAGTKVRVTAGRSAWVLSKGEGIEVETFDEVQVENVSGAVDLVSLRAGFGRLVSQGEGKTVTVANAVEIDDTTPIDVAVPAGVVIDDTTPVAVAVEDATPVRVEVVTQPTITATVNHANTITDAPDVALTATVATLIAAAKAGRTELIVKNPSSNAASVRLGGATVGAARGVELEPGESTILTTSAAVYGYSVPGESVSVTELEVV